MIKRKKAAGVVVRKVPEDILVRTIYGETELAKAYCHACNTIKYKFEFYLESSSKRKLENQIRKQCVECWDIYKGSTDYNNPYYANLKYTRECSNEY